MSAEPRPLYSLPRTLALTDGIYAVAMTLLTFDLKLPAPHALHSEAALVDALLTLGPKFLNWLMSFFVLALFWLGQQRSISRLARIDGRLVVYTLVQLALVGLMPFSCSLLGEHVGVVSQAIYALNMALLSATAWLVAVHVYRHPDLTHEPMPRRELNRASGRIGMLVVVSAATVLIQWRVGGQGSANYAFLLMFAGPLSRRSSRLSRWLGRATD